MPLDDLNALAELVNLRGYGLWQIGKRSDALAFYHYALRLFQMSGKTLGIAGVMLNISSVYDSESRLDLAVEWVRKALAVARGADDILLTAEVAQHLASLLREGGSIVEINQLYELSITNFRSVNELDKAADAQFDYALHRFECGDIETALSLARDTISLYEQSGEERIQLIRGWMKQVEGLTNSDEKMP
jgi:tetratricopeptide (TPR) repeat protein